MSDITQSFSQLLLTYGPGAMLDLPDHAVVVAGLQDWKYGANWQPLSEDRLVPLLRQQLGEKLSPNFKGLRQPPSYDEERHDNHAPGVEVRLFPTWFIVDDKNSPEGVDGAAATNIEKRRRVVEFGDLSMTKAGKLTYKGDAKRTDVNPIRFVGACAKGHLQDIDWRRLAHRSGDRSCRKPLYWVERGVSSDPSDIAIRCTCGAAVTLGDLYKPKFLGACECHSPWLTPRYVAEEVCNKELKLLPRSATNTYFSQTITIISLTKSNDRLQQVLSEHGANIEGIKKLPNFIEILRLLPTTSEAFKEFSDEEISSALKNDTSQTDASSPNPKIAEFALLASGSPTIGHNAPGSFLYAETLPRSQLDSCPTWQQALVNVVKVHRLREVTCLYGFTRLEPPPSSAESELDEIQLAVDGADLAREVEWLPAIEQYGEGVFLHFSPIFIRDWLQRPVVVEKAIEFRAAERRDAERFGRKPIHLSPAYWALHSLSHAFMTELSLDCGYPISSLKERIYASAGGQQDRFGILIYTSTAGGQGTLGGLSSMAERSAMLLSRATGRLSLCSNDPICAEHSSGSSDDRYLQGAACHACLLVPETSCEARNTRLDRNLITQTLLQSGANLIDLKHQSIHNSAL